MLHIRDNTVRRKSKKYVMSLWGFLPLDIDGFVQERGNSIANALELSFLH